MAFLVTASGYERGSLRRGGVVVRAVEDGIAVGSWSDDGDGWRRGGDGVRGMAAK